MVNYYFPGIVLTSGMVVMCLYSAFLQFMQSRHSRSRRVLGWVMVLWSLSYLSGLMLLLRGGEGSPDSGVMRPYSLTVGTFAVFITTCYVFEVLRPGWITLRRGLALFSPYLLVLAIYAGVLAVRREPVAFMADMDMFMASLSQFNVWYRLILVFFTVGYLAVMLLAFVHFAPEYRRWTDDTYSSTERMDISWLRLFMVGLVCMTAIFLYRLTDERPETLLIHFLIVYLFFPYINYKALFQQNPFPENYFREQLADEPAIEAQEEVDAEHLFLEKLEEYKGLFERWMQESRPFLDPDFNRAMVEEQLQLNRTYLSQFFREGYGMPFRQLVRHYRVEEAKRLMQEKPQATTKQLSIRCGFSSDTVFHRTFTENTGLTPKQYRLKLEEEAAAEE
ncbi:helix-turn-helix domain-containing protein [Parabacteroides sp. PF5-6]|uniref:helix-turn-helix domain-containing protein n=1 Tax=Parabacteroides sp. PF5-6 TaxID=1742403 RepID=UPI00240656E8|nr:helix-turn-helix domain-containing protein [Parabacteroides sp. PF5-6]MDF9829242.1 AraC-like DNA-binding protein [Parabacteroides sp. PF5-6]